MMHWGMSLKWAAGRALPICAIVGIVSSADGDDGGAGHPAANRAADRAADVTALVTGRTWLLTGRDTYKLDGKNAAEDQVFDTDGPFRATFMDGSKVELDNRPFGLIPGTWTPGAGRNIDLNVDVEGGSFPVVYDLFLRGLIVDELRQRTARPLVLGENVFIDPSEEDRPPLGLRARVAAKGLQLTLILRNTRTYVVTTTDPRTGRVRSRRGVFRQLGKFRGPLVQ